MEKYIIRSKWNAFTTEYSQIQDINALVQGINYI